MTNDATPNDEARVHAWATQAVADLMRRVLHALAAQLEDQAADLQTRAERFRRGRGW